MRITSWRRALAVVVAPIMPVGFVVGAPAPASAEAGACDSTAGNIVSNCGFETGDFQGWTLGGASATTWVRSTADVAWFTPHTGSYGVLTGESSEGTLTQSLATESGRVYDVGLWLRVKPASGTNAAAYVVLEVDPDGTGPADWTSPPLVDVHGPGDESYVQHTGTFTAGGPAATLRLRYLDSPDYWFIDDVTVVARPLPAQQPAQQPDGWIRKAGTSFVGNDVYNTTADQQTVRGRAHRTQVRTFGVRIYHDGSHPATFTVRGTSSARGVRVHYLLGGQDVTAAMRSSAGLSLALSPGGYRALQVQVRIGRHAAIGARKFALVSATWAGSGQLRQDAVKAVVRVVR